MLKSHGKKSKINSFHFIFIMQHLELASTEVSDKIKALTLSPLECQKEGTEIGAE